MKALWSAIWRQLVLRSYFIRNLKTSLVVGIILNLINQGAVLLAGNWSEVNYWQALLTFIVPFGVSAYAAATTSINRPE